MLYEVITVSATIFSFLADANINVDMIVQNISEDGKTTDLTFTVPKLELANAVDIIKSHKDVINYRDVMSAANVVKVSIVGVGMRSHVGVASTMFV